jgi:hypothetical protein
VADLGVPTDPKNQLAWLRKRVTSLEEALAVSRREILESHARLTVISKIVSDNDRCERAPSVTFGAVRAALYAERPPRDLFGS